jgi:sterol 3beta-glucosyltransferase
MPEHLREPDDGADEDLTATTQGPTQYMNMNQSIFGLIAAAGSRIDFNERFDSPSSDDEDAGPHKAHEQQSRKRHFPQTQTLTSQNSHPPRDTSGREHKGRHLRKLSERRLLKSLPTLPRLGRSKLKHDKKDSTSSPRVSETLVEDSAEHSDSSSSLDESHEENRLAPVMSRMLEARAEMAARPSFDLERLSSDTSRDVDAGEGEHSALAKKLKEIFEFEHSEAVICGRLPCPFLSVLLFLSIASPPPPIFVYGLVTDMMVIQSIRAGYSKAFYFKATCT